LRKFHVVNRRGGGWSFSTNPGSIFKDLDEVLKHMERQHGDFKIVVATDSYVIFET